jgi:anthranilate synthase component 1
LLVTSVTDIHADLITPLGAYLRLRESSAAGFLLESVEKGRLGRYSLVGAGARLVSFEEAEREVGAGRPVVGYLGYDHVAKLEPSVWLPADGPALPESLFVVADVLVRFDHAASTAEVLAGDAAEVAARLASALPEAATSPIRGGRTQRFPSREAYETGVRRAKEHIRDGDAFQIVLSQRAERPTDVSALSLYRSLRRVNPSPYHFLLELGEVSLVGSSPETLVKLEGRRASLNPIAGTTAPGSGDAEHLLASEKDRAEHVMLVDLGRNDLSRVCRPGTVRVGRFLEPERYSHVTHLVSEVAGELLPERGPFDLLRACFPAGTVSGAPKIRAMQIISELEGYRRGPYAGAVGYALPGGAFDTCIAIRTVVLADGVARLQAGAGIVADSDPAAEHEECLRKLAALEKALEEAETAGSWDVAGKGGKRAVRRTAQDSADKHREHSILPPAVSGGGEAGLRPAGGPAGQEDAER